MKTRIIGIIFILVLIVATVLCLVTINKNSQENNKANRVVSGSVNVDTSVKDVDEKQLNSEVNNYKESDFKFNTETIITLSDDNTNVEGSNVKIDGNTIYITASGAYRITGSLTDGRIIVNAPKENVKIILDNANINCSYSSAIYVYKSSATMVYLNDGTINSISDGTTYNYNDDFSSEEDEEPNAALYSKSDLIICGNGSLNVKGNFNNGITSKDTLYIKDVTLSVEAKNHGINGKDNATYDNTTINVVAGGDGLRSTNDTDTTLGWIRFSNSTVSINSKEDAIQAETDLIINGGTFNIVTGDGSSSSNKIDNSMPGREKWGKGMSNNSSSDEISRKGIKAGRYILIKDSPTLNIDSADDAIHSSASLQIDNGTYTIKTGDDGIHADDTLTINNGTITISESYEGLEGNNVVINDGNVDIKSSDDGININGGNDNSGFGGFGNFGGKPNGMKRPNESEDGTLNPSDIPNFDGDSNTPPEIPDFGGEVPSFDGEIPNYEDGNFPERQDDGDTHESNSSSYKLIINGGTIIVNANGDGLDSNGSIEMNGGYVVVQGPTTSMNGAIDYENSFTVNGGTIFAIGASGMVQGVKSENQASIMTTISDNQNANTKIEIKDENGKTLLEETSLKSFNSVVFSSKDLELDKTYSIYLNGELSTTTTATLNSASSDFGGFGGMRGK